jgi:hypothetical protein
VLCAGRRGSKYLLNDTHAVGGPSAGLVGYATNQPTKGSSIKEIDEARIYTIPSRVVLKQRISSLVSL